MKSFPNNGQRARQWVPRFLFFGVLIFVVYKVIMFYMGYFNQIDEILK